MEEISLFQITVKKSLQSLNETERETNRRRKKTRPEIIIIECFFLNKNEINIEICHICSISGVNQMMFS